MLVFDVHWTGDGGCGKEWCLKAGKMGCSDVEGIWVMKELRKGRIARIYVFKRPVFLFSLTFDPTDHPCRDD